VVLLLVLCSAEVRLQFDLRLDAIITMVAIWGFGAGACGGEP
jgi:hypothetical protein